MSAHLVKGDDPILRVDAVDALIDELLGPDDRAFAVEDRLVPPKGEGDGGGADARAAAVDATVNGATTPPFMTEGRVVVLRDVGLLSADEVQPIIRYLDDPLPTTSLVLVAGGGTIAKALEAAVKAHGTVHAPAATKAVDVLAATLDTAGIRVGNDAAQAIVAHVGADAGLIPGIVATLASTFGPDVQLHAADVEPYLGGEGTVPVWDLTNAIDKGNTTDALVVLQRLLRVTSPKQPKPVHPLQVLAILQSHFRRLLTLDDPAIRSAEDAAAALGGRTSPNAARHRLRQSRALGTAGLRQAFDHLARADLDLKGKRAIPEGAVLEILVARLCGLSARAGAGRR
ncbi:MAG TPA: hypothetical protein VFW06_05715 [Acidimicrobiia bacterium]|nr:hypothetical protein [Acidimicrobiia bacterium]